MYKGYFVLVIQFWHRGYPTPKIWVISNVFIFLIRGIMHIKCTYVCRWWDPYIFPLKKAWYVCKWVKTIDFLITCHPSVQQIFSRAPLFTFCSRYINDMYEFLKDCWIVYLVSTYIHFQMALKLSHKEHLLFVCLFVWICAWSNGFAILAVFAMKVERVLEADVL